MRATGTSKITRRAARELLAASSQRWLVEYDPPGAARVTIDVVAPGWFEARERFAHALDLDPYDPRIRATRRA